MVCSSSVFLISSSHCSPILVAMAEFTGLLRSGCLEAEGRLCKETPALCLVGGVWCERLFVCRGFKNCIILKKLFISFPSMRLGK